MKAQIKIVYVKMTNPIQLFEDISPFKATFNLQCNAIYQQINITFNV